MSEKVLAVAAGHEITEGEVNDLIKNYPPEQQIYMSSPQAKQQVLEQIIAFHLFHQMAIDEKIPESKEYKEMIEKMQVELASHMAATSVIENIKVDEAEEKAFYEENPDLFVAKPQVNAKHILVDSEDSANDIAKDLHLKKQQRNILLAHPKNRAEIWDISPRDRWYRSLKRQLLKVKLEK